MKMDLKAIKLSKIAMRIVYIDNILVNENTL